MGFMPLLTLLITLHAAMVLGNLFIYNLQHPDQADYGVNAFLPTGGADPSHPYNRAFTFLRPLDANGNLVGVASPPSGGLFPYLLWAVKVPVCGMSGLTGAIVGYSTFSYDVIDIIPDDGWGGWLKTFIHLIGTLITLTLLVQVFGMLSKMGIVQSPKMLIALGIAGGTLLGGAFLVAGGIVACGQLAY